MSILSVTVGQSGLVGVKPQLNYIVTNDTEATVTTAGYLNKAVAQGFAFDNGSLAAVQTKTSPSSTVINTGWYEIKHSGVNWSLVATTQPGSVTLPTIANHLAVFTDTTGSIGEDVATAIQGSNLQAGLSGTAGTLASFPSTASKGSLKLVAVANTGNTVTTISNAAMGQASVVSIPDPAAATANFVVAPASLVSGKLVKASGTAGLIVDAGIVATEVMQTTAVNTMTGAGQIILAKANGTETSNAVTASGNAGVITTSSLSTAAGATYSITWTNTKITTTSVISLTIQGGSNTVQTVVFTCAPGAGTATLVINNIGPTSALNGTILIGYTVL